MCVVAALLVVLLGASVSVDSRLVELDLAVVRGMHEAAITSLTQVVLHLTALGGTEGAGLVTAVFAFGLVVLRQWHAALALVLSVAATQAVVDVIKSLVERGRPPAADAQIEASGYAFPSAHSATSMALYGLLALVAIGHLRGRARTFACAAAALVVLGVGLTRLYLGAHYPTDVLAGWLVGAVVALGSWRLAQHLRGLAERRVAAATA